MKKLQRQFSFDQIIVVPSHYPPGKSAKAPFQKRFDWAKKLFKEKYFEVSGFEKNATQTVFAKDIFYHFSAKAPRSKFYWVLGEDQWRQLAYWKEIDKYASHLEWIVLGREKMNLADAGLLSKRLLRSSCAYQNAAVGAMSEISSTRIRKCIEDKQLKSKPLKWIPESIRKDVTAAYSSKEDQR